MPFVRFCSATFFCLRETACAVSLSQTKKRQLQPERYVKWVAKLVEKIIEDILTIGIILIKIEIYWRNL
jgi:predicted metal-binding transcription factor (methanogenesis marker protein 9)